jgi:hypothetical protein
MQSKAYFSRRYHSNAENARKEKESCGLKCIIKIRLWCLWLLLRSGGVYLPLMEKNHHGRHLPAALFAPVQA